MPLTYFSFLFFSRKILLMIGIRFSCHIIFSGAAADGTVSAQFSSAFPSPRILSGGRSTPHQLLRSCSLTPNRPAVLCVSSFNATPFSMTSRCPYSCPTTDLWLSLTSWDLGNSEHAGPSRLPRGSDAQQGGEPLAQHGGCSGESLLSTCRVLRSSWAPTPRNHPGSFQTFLWEGIVLKRDLNGIVVTINMLLCYCKLAFVH